MFYQSQRRYLLTSLCAYTLVSTTAALPQAFTDDKSRHDVARALSEVHIGMSALQVSEILGTPDDIRTEHDQALTATVAEVWCYGAHGHMELPTLGKVYINHERTVFAVFGGLGAPPARTDLTEDELRHLLGLIHSAPSMWRLQSWDAWGYDPRSFVTACNELIKAGKNEVLAALREYVRIHKGKIRSGIVYSSDIDRIPMIILSLFDFPDTSALPATVKGCDELCRLIPTLPVLVICDVPLLLHPISLCSSRIGESEILAYLRDAERDTATLRESFRPINDLELILHEARQLLDPIFDVLNRDRTRSEAVWKQIQREARWLIGNQVIRLARTVKQYDFDAHDYLVSSPVGANNAWEYYVSMLPDIQIQWDPDNDMFVGVDGWHLPIPRRSWHPRRHWNPDIPELDLHFVTSRRDERHISLLVNCVQMPSSEYLPLRIRIIGTEDDSESIVDEFMIESTDVPASASYRKIVELQIDVKARIECVLLDGRVIANYELSI